MNTIKSSSPDAKPIGHPRRRDTVDQDLGAVDNFGKEPTAYDWFGEIDQADGKEEKEDGAMVANIRVNKPATPYFQEYIGYNGEFRKDIDKYLLLPPADAKIHPAEEVGDSDEELSDSDREEDGSPVIAKFCFDSPIKPKEVTIICSDGVIKGDELIYDVHKMLESRIQHLQRKFPRCAKDKIDIQEGDEWLSAAGHWAKSMADSEIKAPFHFEEIQVGFSHANVQMRYEGSSERLWFSAKPGEIQQDFSCREIYEITETLKEEHGKSDNRLAMLQIQRLVGLGILKEEETPPELGHWLDCVNAWLFGVEASRVNTTFVTGVMVLELIRAGKMTYKEALAEGDFGGQIPLATVASGAGNFRARGRLLEHVEKKRPAGLSIDRQNPQWLAVTLKEAMVIKNWLKFKRVINRKRSRSEQKTEITKTIIDLIKTYYSPSLVSDYIDEQLERHYERQADIARGK